LVLRHAQHFGDLIALHDLSSTADRLEPGSEQAVCSTRVEMIQHYGPCVIVPVVLQLRDVNTSLLGLADCDVEALLGTIDVNALPHV